MFGLRIFLLFLCFKHGFPHQKEVPDEACIFKSISEDELFAYIGWPYKIRFDLFYKGSDHTALNNIRKELRYKENILCLIRNDHGVVILNKTAALNNLEEVHIILPDLYPENSTEFVLEIQASRLNKCLSINLQLILTPFQSSYWKQLPLYKGNAKLGNQFNFDCSDHGALVPRVQDWFATDYKWRRNSSSLPIIGTTKLYTVSSMTWNDEGVYICSVTYKGMNRALLVQSINVTCPTVSLISTPILTCSSDVLFRNKGRDAKVTCQGVIGIGAPTKRHFRYYWSKAFPNGNIITKKRCRHALKSRDNYHVSCTYEIEKQSNVDCNVSSAVVRLYFNIKNITDEDFGEYVLELQTTVRGSSPVNSTFLLQPNVAPHLITRISIIMTCIGLLSFILLSAGIICCHLPHIRVLAKRHFGEYEKDDKKHGAYFAYNFSKEFDTFYQEQVHQSVKMTRSILEEMGYNVYDENKDGCYEQCKAQNIQWGIEQSHRVIFFLSFEFIKDEWSLKTLYQGFNETIKNPESKMIFIMLPGISEHLRQRRFHDVTCFMIRRSMQLNYVIKWSSKRDFNKQKFKLQLEDAMPKLMSQKVKRFKSSSSDIDLYVPNYKNVSFQYQK